MSLTKSGIFLVDKPKGITSNDLIQIIKNKFSIKKIGHTGTLDPLATGLMVVLVNQATKISDYILSNDKEYLVEIKLFVKTNTGDITGEIVNQVEPRKISKKDIMSIVNKYDGYIYDQTPPIFSAIKVNGKKLYEYARQNKQDEVEIQARPVTIKKCQLIKFDPKENVIILSLECSKGTYVRSFIEDFCIDLKTIGTVQNLKRISLGNFLLTQAKNLENIIPDDLLDIYQALIINNKPIINYHNEIEIKQGKLIKLHNIDFETIFISNNKNEIIAIYEKIAQNIFVCKRGLWDIDQNQANLTEAEREETFWK